MAGMLTLRGFLRGGRASAVIALVLATFVLQTVITRAHMHTGQASGPSQVVDLGVIGDPGKTPVPHEERHCQLWHASGVSGAAVAPTAPCILLPADDLTAFVAFDVRTIFPERFPSAWRSRGPPTA